MWSYSELSTQQPCSAFFIFWNSFPEITPETTLLSFLFKCKGLNVLKSPFCCTELQRSLYLKFFPSIQWKIFLLWSFKILHRFTCNVVWNLLPNWSSLLLNTVSAVWNLSMQHWQLEDNDMQIILTRVI